MDARPERLREAEEALRTVQEAELPAWMRRAFDILLGRADGRWVALSLLAYLGRRTLLGPSAHGFEPRWSVDACGLEALARALAATGTQVDDVRKFSRDRELVAEEESSSRRERRRVHGGELPEMDGPPGEGERRLCGEGLPLLLGAAAMAGVDAGPDEASALFDWLVELLEGRDPGLELAGHGAPLEELPRRLGRLLLRLPEPAPSLKGAYQRLEPQRRRGLFAHRYREPARDLESVLLLRTALHVSAADPESRSRLDASGRHELFHWTYEAARRLWLTAPWDPGREKEELVTLCFAFMPHVFGGAIGEALRRVVPPIAAEPAMICRAACLLWRNGLEPEQVQILLADAGVDLQAALLAARDWSTLTRREDDFPSAFQELASGLGLELTARGP